MYGKIAKIKKERELILKELPEFTNRLILMLNAGLVVSQAIERAASDGGDTYFYNELEAIRKKTESVNSSFTDGLRELAVKSGTRELLRISNIINDNMDKGSELAEKLDREAEFMWYMSKKMVEEKGRLAESKMTFPIALILIALIMITAAPAFMSF